MFNFANSPVLLKNLLNHHPGCNASHLMNIESFRNYCLQKNGVEESCPFGPDTLVFKVMGKMFTLTSLKGDFRINLKCLPDKAIDLRERYPAVQPGYHMNKKHWITVCVDGSIEDALLQEWIDDSYDLVVKTLPTTLQAGLI
jgi:predicted DNA-binding protein (MmcQ/YjbR family)